ncbi:hypothetical protein [Roseovarius aestuariivivens]|uniref:hypothetical protein n=1 Tax=Roseovarius aestuariivivens TaxID=1888910 RepID=UPI001080BCFC|nr:hypothetical protein [Roseovarius aestuariivivens]
MRDLKRLLLGTALCVLTATATFAADPVKQHNSNAVWFENWIGLSHATLTVTAPDGEVTKIEAMSGTPVFELSGREALDGIYRYELTAATDEEVEIKNQIDNGRGAQARSTAKVPYYETGSFVVSRGVIIVPERVEEEG